MGKLKKNSLRGKMYEMLEANSFLATFDLKERLGEHEDFTMARLFSELY